MNNYRIVALDVRHPLDLAKTMAKMANPGAIGVQKQQICGAQAEISMQCGGQSLAKWPILRDVVTLLVQGAGITPCVSFYTFLADTPTNLLIIIMGLPNAYRTVWK